MTKRIITENEMDKLLDQLTWKVELKYSERPGFKQIIDAVKKKRANCVHMVYVSTLSQNPAGQSAFLEKHPYYKVYPFIRSLCAAGSNFRDFY